MNSISNQNATIFNDTQEKNYFIDKKNNEPIHSSPVKDKPINISFDGDVISSDAGVLLLKEVEQHIGIINSIASVITDERDKRYVEHTLQQLLVQRVFQIACGYEDANDCNSLRDDPIFKICADKLPTTDSSLASQPTMTRFENSISMKSNYLIAKAFADIFINSYTEEPEVIVIDFDDTDDTVHGNQQLSVFNNFFKEYCFMPLHVYEGLSGKLITTILKPGKRLTGKAILAILKRLVAHIRLHWKNTIIVFRGDSHFSSPEVMQFIDKQDNISYVTGFTSYSTLDKFSEATLENAKSMFKRSHRNVKLYHSFFYKAASWNKSQRVIVKVEVSDKGVNTRYIVTDMFNAKAKALYEDVYCKRGSMELYIKNHKTYLKSDRTSCHSFKANQFRLFLHSAAYVLIHALQNELLRTTEFRKATMQTIQLKIFKIGARIKELKTRINILLPVSYPHQLLFRNVFSISNCLRC
jgi:hypothetical protein